MRPDESQLKRKAKILQKAVTQEKSKRDKLKGDITKIKKKADRKHAQYAVTIQSNKNDPKYPFVIRAS